MKRRLAVIGNGMAASRLVDELLRRRPDVFDITIFGDERHPAYNRILLGRLLAGGDASDIALKDPDADCGVTLRTGVRVAAVDPTARRLTTDAGDEVPFDVCVFATGSSALIPSVPGLVGDDGGPRRGVHGFRTVEDGLAIRASARPGSSAVVVGGGLLGLEAAKSLSDLGLHVTVLHLADGLMNAQLDRLGGELLRGALERQGLFVRTGTTADEVLGNGHVEAVRLRTGEVIAADLLVFACGIVPRVEVARASGVPVGRGILVNDCLATACPGVYAVGECAEHRGRVYGLVQPIWEQCEVLADVLTGANPQARYRGSKVYARLKVAGVEVASMGRTDAELPTDEVVQVIEERRGVYRKLVVRDGKLLGAMLVGCAEAAPGLVQMFDRDEPLPTNRLDVLATGRAWGTPADREVCSCHHVTEVAVQGAIQSGCDTLARLCEATRAGTGCGSCRGRLADLLAIGTQAAV